MTTLEPNFPNKNHISAYFFDDLLATCCHEIIARGMDTEFLPSTIKDWLAGKILRSLPKRFVQKFVSFMLENRDFSDHLGYKENGRGTEFTMVFHKSNSERAQKQRAIVDQNKANFEKELYGNLAPPNADDSELDLKIFNEKYETLGFDLAADELILENRGRKNYDLPNGPDFSEMDLNSTLPKLPKETEVEKLAKERDKYEKRQFLDRYVITKPETGTFACKICQKEYENKLSLHQHIRNGHSAFENSHSSASSSNPKKLDLECQICHNKFDRKSRLSQHYANKHGKNGKLAEAELLIFGKIITEVDHITKDPRGRKRKQPSALDPTIYNPETGLKWNSPKERLKKYPEIRYDENLDTFICDPCGKSYTVIKHALRHVEQVHYKILKHKCHLCDAAFGDSFKLRCHVDSIHSKDLKYFCPICQRGCSNEENLREHKKRSHPTEYQMERKLFLEKQAADKKAKMQFKISIDDYEKQQLNLA